MSEEYPTVDPGDGTSRQRFCPHCRGAPLQPLLTSQFIEIDYCPTCQGTWLDPDEILAFSLVPDKARRQLQVAAQHPRKTHLRSPVANRPLYEIDYPGGAVILVCPESGGAWLDPAAREALRHADPAITVDADDALAATVRHPVVPGPGAAATLLRLPNLVLRSAMTLLGLYALLTLILITAVELGGLSVDMALFTGVAIALFQFVAGPWILDLTLQWLYTSSKLTPQELPDHLRRFVDRVCNEQGIRFPCFRLIHDGAPQAFTYGHVPANARIVLSQGTMDLLSAEELEAVVAHEIGHVVHWDMLVMTMAQIVPLIAYYFYRMLAERESRSDREDKDGDLSQLIATGAYLVYVISEFIVLAFSRGREYHADRFSGRVTGEPAHLASALVKIAYGLAGYGPEREGETKETSRTPKLGAIGALGIFSVKAAKGFAIAGYAETTQGADRTETIRGAMRWDLFNPWARWYELNSTHPLVAKRLRYLGNQARVMGLEPFIEFDETPPESYWDEFLLDFVVDYLPLFMGVATVLSLGMFSVTGEISFHLTHPVLAIAAIALGAAMLVRWSYRYRGAEFPESTVAALVRQVKVSGVRPIPCTLTGVCIGRGMPGYVFSEDFVLKDDTGIIFLDYRQPLAIWEWMFGLLRAGNYTGRRVRVTGWYRRSPMPYVQLARIESDGVSARSWAPLVERFSAIAILVFGVVLLARPDLIG